MMNERLVQAFLVAFGMCTVACSPSPAGPHNDASGHDGGVDASDAGLASEDAPMADGGIDAGDRCTTNAGCAAGHVCSAHACVPAGFGFVGTYTPVTTADAGPVTGLGSDWPVINGSERGARRSDVPGVLARPMARWRFDTGQSLSASRVAIVDVDGDGVSEIVTAEGGGLRARSQDGHELWRTTFLGASIVIASAADLDGDHRADFTVYADPPRVAVIHGLDGAVLGDQADYATGYVQALVIPDMSGDGRPDVATFAKNLDRPQSFVVRVLSLGATGLTQLWRFEEANGYYGGPVAIAGDVDGDGTSELTVHEYLYGWFRSFDRTGHVVVDGGGPRSGNAMYLRDVDGNPATIDLLNAQDRNGVQADGHEVGVYRRNAGTWENRWRAYATDPPPSQPILSTPWADAASDFDGMGPVEMLMGVYDYDTTRSASHWSTVMLRANDGMRLGSMTDQVPQAVVQITPTTPPAILAMSVPDAVAPPLGMVSFVRWTGALFDAVWSRTDAAPAPISTRIDVLGTTGVSSPYLSHGGVADIDGDGTNEVLLFARGTASEFGDRPGELLAVSATDGSTVVAYGVPPEDLVEVIGVEGAGDTLRVWLSSHQLGLIALDRHFDVVRRLPGSGFRPTALVLATAHGPRALVTDSSDVTHVLRTDPNSADFVETARLNHLTFVLGTERGAMDEMVVLVQDRNGGHNVLGRWIEQADGSLAPGWTFPLSDAESVQVVSHGNFGSPAVPGYVVQIRNTLDLPSSRYVALRAADGTMLWAQTEPPPRPYVRNTVLSSGVVSCAGSDHVLVCSTGCRCLLIAGTDGAMTSTAPVSGCDALSVTEGRTTSAGETPIVIGGSAYATDFVTLHADCSFGSSGSFASALQSSAALTLGNADAVLDVAYWSDTACMITRDGTNGTTLWSHLYVGGAAMTCTPGLAAQRYASTAAVAADIDGNGSEEVVFGTGDGNLLAVAASSGDVRAMIQMQRLLRDPVLGDVDGDRRPEILIGADDGYLYAFAQPTP